MDPEKRIKEIESLAGVNFEELRSKYSKLAAAQPKPTDIPNDYGVFSALPHTIIKSGKPTHDTLKTDATIAVQPEPTNFGKSKICKVCNGQGVTTYIYNHMVLSQNCEKCDGEGVYIPDEVVASSGNPDDSP